MVLILYTSITRMELYFIPAKIYKYFPLITLVLEQSQFLSQKLKLLMILPWLLLIFLIFNLFIITRIFLYIFKLIAYATFILAPCLSQVTSWKSFMYSLYSPLGYLPLTTQTQPLDFCLNGLEVKNHLHAIKSSSFQFSSGLMFSGFPFQSSYFVS